MDIKPIETKYKGYKFRSRAEARWAVLFDNLGIRYVYEPEGYKLSDGTMYLPDFFLISSKSFFEVKGLMSDKDLHKIEMLISDLGKSVTIGYADLSFQSCDNWCDAGYSLTDKDSSVLVKCRKCKQWYFSGTNGSYVCQCCGEYDGDHLFDVRAYGEECVWIDMDEETKNAFDSAKQARFEHGQQPNIKEITFKRLMRQTYSELFPEAGIEVKK